MYDKLFSQQWIFDRHLEGERFFVPLNLILCVLVLFGLFLFFRKLKFEKKALIFSMVGSGIVLLPSLFISTFLIGIFSSSDWQFWQGVNPANELYTQVKYVCSSGHCPQSEKELASLNPPLYKQIMENAKSKYTYNPKTKKYTWYVRPSRYYMVSFEGNGFGVFKIPNLLDIKHWNLPTFSGNINELPQ